MIQKVISHLFVFPYHGTTHRTATASPWNIKHNTHNKDVKENN